MWTGYFIGIFLAIVHVSSGLPDACPCLAADPCLQCRVFLQNAPTSCSMFSNNPGVSLFTKTLEQLIYTSDILTAVFDLSQATPLQYSKFLYKYNLDIYTEKGFKNAAEIAEFSARGVAWNFKVLTLPLIVRVIQNTAASFLFVEGILTTENAEDLALVYADTIESYARANLTSYVASKFKTLGDTFFNFVLKVDGNEKSIYPFTTYYFGNAWFEAAVKCRWLNW